MRTVAPHIAGNTTGRYRPYPRYKNSGVECLEEIPEHWECRRLKTVTQFAYGDSLSADDRIPGEVLVYGSNGVIGEHNTANTVGPCLVIGRKGSYGKITYSVAPSFAIDTTYFIDKRHTKQDLRWLYYCLVSLELDAFSKDSAVPGLAREEAYERIVPFCGTEEQRAIAAFLDQETARIDALIEKKERQIELLQEKRAAVISHAVTKGLNPNVKMKDSGIEWLGEIPEHWETFVLRRVATRIQTGSTPPTAEERYYENGSIPWYGPGSFGVDLVLNVPVKSIAEEAVRDGVARLFHRDSAMIVTIGATIGKVGYIDHNASCNQQITVATFDNRKVVGKFAAYQLKRLEPVLQGIAHSTTLPIMSQHQVGDLPVALPPLGEQRAIIAYIDAEAHKIDVLVCKIQESIIKLREYRTALITAAVTGKIDVREDVA